MKPILKFITSFAGILLVIFFCVVATSDVSYSQINEDSIRTSFYAVFNDLFYDKFSTGDLSIKTAESNSTDTGIEAGTVLLFGAGILCMGLVGRFGPFKRY